MTARVTTNVMVKSADRSIQGIRYYIDQSDLNMLLMLFMVFIYPLIVIPGSLSYFYGPRYIVLIFASLFAAIILYKNGLKLDNIAWIPLTSFVVFLIIATLFSDNIVLSWGGSSFRFTGASTYLFCAFLFLIATQNHDRLRIIKAMVIAAAIVSFIAILQHYGLNIVPHEHFREGYHSYGTLGNPNFLGTYTVFISPAAIMLYLKENRDQWLVCSGLIFTALMASLTRGAWLAFLVIFTIILYYVYLNPQFRKRTIYIILLFVVITAVLNFSSGFIVADRAVTIQEEVKTLNEFTGSSVSIRIFVWKETLKIISENWAFGVGPDNLRIFVTQNHVEDNAFNFLLEIASTMGIFALIAYLSLIIFSLRQNKGWFGTMLTFMITAYLLQAQFNIEVIMNLPLFWIVLGLTWANEKSIDGINNIDELISVNSKIAVRPSIITYVLGIGILLLTIFIASLFYYPRTGTVEIDGHGIYQGQLRGVNIFHGEGLFSFDNGVKYEGKFKNGFFDGYGTLSYPNGALYVGHFKESYFHGEGKFILQDGTVQKGIWNMGIYVSD